MKQILYLISILSIALSACDKHDVPFDEPIVEPTIEIQAFYSIDGNTKQPLYQAVVYIYNNTPISDFSFFTYEGNGVYTRKEKTITPSQIMETDINGKVSIKPLCYDKPISVFVEDKIGKQMSHSSWPNCTEKLIETITFYRNTVK